MKLYSIVVPYLLLVSFYSGQINNFGVDKIQAINDSFYDGVAVPLIDAYDTGKYLDKNFNEALSLIKRKSKKHIWPWVFFNRFYGYQEKEDPECDTKKEYFRKIKGIDIYNDAKALGDFYDLWRLSLSIAKTLGSPGIFADAEAYNLRSYDISIIAQMNGKTNKEIQRQLMSIGSKLTDIVSEEYPDAIIWFTFTGLDNPKTSTVSYIIFGMLGRIREKNIKSIIIDGGMQSLGYCFDSLSDLQSLIRSRELRFKTLIEQHPGLKLGGTIAPWHDSNEKKDGFFARGKCGKVSMKGINDFKPLFKELFKSYNYNWVYAASDVGFNPYDPKVNVYYNNALKDTLRGSLQE